jgi:hypothetical protein
MLDVSTDDFAREVAHQQIYFEHIAGQDLRLLLEMVRRAHHDDLATLITVGLGAVDHDVAREWHRALCKAPDRGGPPDHYERERLVALSLLLAAR